MIVIADAAEAFGRRLNWVVERICALLMATLVLVIWFEVLQRYVLHLGFTWGEEFSRYVMIWAALLAVPVAQYATIFGMTMVVPFASVPVCGLLTSVQIAVTLLRDWAPKTGEAAP